MITLEAIFERAGLGDLSLEQFENSTHIMDAAREELEKESYEEIKCLLQHPFIGYAGDKLTKTASKLQEAFLAGNDEDAAWLEGELPSFSYKNFYISIQGAEWHFEGVTQSFTEKDLLVGLYTVDLILSFS